MSEYIYKLADGAGADEFQMRKGEYEYCLVGHEAILSFAKSIIDECLAQVDKVDVLLEDDKEKTGVAWVGLAIAKHFGVEK